MNLSSRIALPPSHKATLATFSTATSPWSCLASWCSSHSGLPSNGQHEPTSSLSPIFYSAALHLFLKNTHNISLTCMRRRRRPLFPPAANEGLAGSGLVTQFQPSVNCHRWRPTTTGSGQT
ncbi:unnamed protein product [Vitrella brassicaformis CCMP3155]|uniref:Uncharacterized protein n=1 Tax=Vitrella brassicaformis (strain CCMP3155) TaxID=1169540 RepID=A0A0G4GFF4_VITBC|nr:unnamed protein product [Vitrella brassicaformis CCMP3155]|eukprot:CEM28241.1 unnamed protein product [Vitrella brassicaformis CCMP3155]